MGLCDSAIATNQLRDCDIVGGVENLYTVINKADIVAYVRDEDNTQIVTDITIKVGKKAFQYEGFNNSTKPKTALVVKTYSVRYDQTIDAVIFSRGSATKVELEALALDEVVIIIENKSKQTDQAFEIYGLDIGLRLKALTDDPTNADNEGAYIIQWGSPDNYKEPHLPATFFDTSYAVTKAAVAALLVVAA